jgi:hypothetical protein
MVPGQVDGEDVVLSRRMMRSSRSEPSALIKWGHPLREKSEHRKLLNRSSRNRRAAASAVKEQRDITI